MTACGWCGTTVPVPDGAGLVRCPGCGMTVTAVSAAGPFTESTATAVPRPRRARTASRTASPRRTPLNPTPVGRPVLGVDPGARYTGVVVRDGDGVLHSSTYVRAPDCSATDWAIEVISRLRELHAEHTINGIELPVGVEGVSDPKGFKSGQHAAINPSGIIRAGVVLGAVVAVWPSAIVVPPGRNGSKHTSHYPSCLVGRRPKGLPGDATGAGTRDHEQSAFDVAGRAALVLWPAQGALPLAVGYAV